MPSDLPRGRCFKAPLHWMRWPAIGVLAIGIHGCFEPRAGRGYDVIGDQRRNHLALGVAAALLAAKAVIQVISLGSGTSSGVLALLLMMSVSPGVVLWPLVSGGCPGQGMAKSARTVEGLQALLIERIEAIPHPCGQVDRCAPRRGDLEGPGPRGRPESDRARGQRSLRAPRRHRANRAQASDAVRPRGLAPALRLAQKSR